MEKHERIYILGEYTLKDKDYLLASMPETFIQQNVFGFFIVKKGSLDFKNVLYVHINNKQKKGYLKVLWETKIGSSYAL